MSEALRPILARLSAGAVLDDEQARTLFRAMLAGEASPVQMAAALTALRVRGESVEEITAFASEMRAAASPFFTQHAVIDTCGTGGDGLDTFNISTTAAIVAAGAGARVAKHGNRALSSRSGSSDVLSALGVDISATTEVQARALDEAGLCFLFAPGYHAATRHAASVRAELGFRTVFNVLGPLSNPAGAKRQLMGVYDPRLIEPLAEVLGRLGSERAWVVHGDGLDELTTTGETLVAQWHEGRLDTFAVRPEDFGLARVDISALRGGDASQNAEALLGVLRGERCAYRDIVLLNAGAALVVAGLRPGLREAITLAGEAIDDGRAMKALQRLRDITGAAR